MGRLRVSGTHRAPQRPAKLSFGAVASEKRWFFWESETKSVAILESCEGSLVSGHLEGKIVSECDEVSERVQVLPVTGAGDARGTAGVQHIQAIGQRQGMRALTK